MTDEERESKRVVAVEMLKIVANQVNALENSIPEICEQILGGGKAFGDLMDVIKEADLLRQTHDVALAEFEAIVFPDSVQNNRQLFFEALDSVKQQRVVTAHDIDLLENLVISSDQVTQDALTEFKQRAAH